MTRYMEKEKVMLSRVTMPAAITRTNGLRGADVVGATLTLRGLVETFRRSMERAAIVRELNGLSDRVLADIGLQRWQIEAVADRAVGGVPSPLALLTGMIEQLATAAARRVGRWYRKRAAYGSLMALDDRMLQDIGLRRDEIPAVVDSLGDGEVPTLGAPAHGLDTDLVRPLRLWNRRRNAAKELSALDDRMLSDIGIMRCDIAAVARQMAERSIEPANGNHTPKAA